MQLLHAVPKLWKEDLSNVKANINNLIIQVHSKHHMYFLNRLSSKETYNFFSLRKKNKLHPSFLSNSLNIPLLTPQSDIFEKKTFLSINHLLFMCKFYIYNSRSSNKLNIEYLKTIIYETRNIELEVSKTETISDRKYFNK